MSTAEALHRWVARLIELCWLVALVSGPLYFNIFSSRIFEPDKIALLRSLALVTAGLILFDRFVLRAQGLKVKLSNPLVWAVLGLAGANVLSSFFSVAPYATLLGSYQRLQGIYSLLSYMTIGAGIFLYLSEPEQLGRLKHFVISTAVPISIYGILQHFNLDPVGWKGNVTFRVSSTLGNPIFLAAYLILVVPVALSQLYTLVACLRNRPADKGGPERAGRLVLAVGLLILQNVVLYLALLGELAYLRLPVTAGQGDVPPLGPWWVMPGAIAVFVALGWAVMRLAGSGRMWIVASIAGTGVSLALVLTTIFLTQSRGPWLGLGAGLLVWTVTLLLIRGRRGWAVATLLGALALGALLVVFNLPSSPMAPLRDVPYLGRLGRLLETETGTGKVRLLIWRGAVQLAARDPLRAVVGYGPDTMFYVFGRVYPPELAHFEARNATPDRAHNALLDAQVNTGAVGLLALLGVFATACLTAVRGLRSMADSGEKVLLVGLSAAVAAHFVEVQTGIQIAATWTYFVAYLGLMGRLVYGAGLQHNPQDGQIVTDKNRGSRGRGQKKPAGGRPLGMPTWVAAAAMGVVIAWLAWYTDLRLIVADMYLQLGQAIGAGGRLDIALAAYIRASETAPDQGYYRFAVAGGAIEMARRAGSQAEQERYFSMAKAALLEATRIEPLNSDHPANVARLLRLWGSATRDPGKLEEAVGWTRRALELSPNNAQLWDELGIGYSMLAQAVGADRRDQWLQNMEEAWRAFQHSLELDPIYAISYIYLGDYYYRPQNDGRAACTSYARALGLDPGALTLDNRAEERVAFCQANGNLGDLVDVLTSYAQRNPDSFQANNILGFVLYHVGRLQEAVDYFRRAEALAPQDFNIHKNLAVVYSDTGRYVDALAELEEAIRLAPQDQAEQLRGLLPYLRSKAGQ